MSRGDALLLAHVASGTQISPLAWFTYGKPKSSIAHLLDRSQWRLQRSVVVDVEAEGLGRE